jgi:predicted Na+-dependent transporter
MTRFYIFLIRVVMGALLAVLMGRFFFPRASIGWVIALAIFIVGLAYLSERFRKRNREPGEGADH